MAKQKTAYVCSDCGAEHTQWQGQCMACNEWNTLTRILLGPATAPSAPKNFKRPPSGGDTGAPVGAVQTLGKIDLEEQPRFTTTIGEFDRVLGGGLVPGSAVLIGGNPGAVG